MPNRRDFCLSVSALATLTPLLERHVLAQAATGSATNGSVAAGTQVLTHNHIFHAAQMPIRQTATGSSQQVLHGVLPTGEGLEMHNSVLAPGHEPHPPHQHPHAEFLFLTEGSVDWLIDGKRQPATGGDILYAAPGVLHGMRNVGTEPARYFVMALGPNLAHDPV